MSKFLNRLWVVAIILGFIFMFLWAAVAIYTMDAAGGILNILQS